MSSYPLRRVDFAYSIELAPGVISSNFRVPDKVDTIVRDGDTVRIVKGEYVIEVPWAKAQYSVPFPPFSASESPEAEPTPVPPAKRKQAVA